MKSGNISGEDFKAIREKLELSRSEMAVLLGKEYQTIHNYETGKTRVSLVIENYLNQMVNNSKKGRKK